MVNKIDRSERLLAGVILIIFSLIGLMFRLTGYESIIRGTRYVYYHSGGYSLPSLMISLIFIIILLLGIYLIYNVTQEEDLAKNKGLIKNYINILEERNRALMEELDKSRQNKKGNL